LPVSFNRIQTGVLPGNTILAISILLLQVTAREARMGKQPPHFFPRRYFLLVFLARLKYRGLIFFANTSRSVGDLLSAKTRGWFVKIKLTVLF
jgi:hypothetical protein